MKLDGIWGGSASYPGKPYCPVVEVAEDNRKPTSTRRTRSDEGAEGGRSTGSTDEVRADEGLVTAWRVTP